AIIKAMASDEERLYDPIEANEENDSTQNIDAASTSPTTTKSNNNEEEAASRASGVKHRWFILEPAVFLVFLSMYLSSTVYQNQLLYQTCIYIKHYNDTVCQPLLGVQPESEEVRRIEIEVQPYVAKILMARSLLESIIPAIVSLFIGPWSDKFGRRPIVLTTFTGYLTGSVILTTLTFISTKTAVSPWVFLLCSVPSVLSGGTCALITGIYCYISDVAKEKNRALRMVLNEASLCAGMMVGNVASGYLYAATDAVTVFIISSSLMLLALLYVIVFVVESLKPEQIHAGSKVREFFRFDLVKDLIQTCLKRRPNYDRIIIWLTMMALTVAIFTMEGDSNVTYLFVRKQFEWTLKDFSIFNAARIVVQIIGSILGMFILRRIFKFSIVSMTMISLASCVLESTVRATAIYWWQLYLGLCFGFMRGIMGPMSRAILSHVAPSTEVGKIFALTTSMESLSPLIAAPLYTLVYNATLVYYPGLFNFISAGLYLLCFTFISTIYGIQKSMGQNATYQAIGS
ncbi:hypothetical protein FF38_13964, partial [Lucilia cuprina]